MNAFKWVEKKRIDVQAIQAFLKVLSTSVKRQVSRLDRKELDAVCQEVERKVQLLQETVKVVNVSSDTENIARMQTAEASSHVVLVQSP